MTEHVPIQSLLRAVSRVFDADVDEMLGRSRYARIALARRVFFGLAPEFCAKMSLADLGRFLGGRHHTTPLASRDHWLAMPDEERQRYRRLVRAQLDRGPTDDDSLIRENAALRTSVAQQQETIKRLTDALDRARGLRYS